MKHTAFVGWSSYPNIIVNPGASVLFNWNQCRSASAQGTGTQPRFNLE